jgi:outer membrane protein assembly factor BamB
MQCSSRFRLFLMLAVLCGGGRLCGADPADSTWPQFRGPNASGIAEHAKPPAKIGPADHVIWKTDVPFAPSSPIIWNENIFLTTFDQGELQTRCYDRASGQLRWTRGIAAKELEPFHRTDGSPAASTPATDGQHVVSYFGSCGLVCYDFEGKELWRHPMPVARTTGDFGSGTSPIIVGSRVILLRDEAGPSKLISLDVNSGQPLWESPRPEATGSYGTPIIWNNQGEQQVITPGSLFLKGYSLESGRESWTVGGLCPFACTTPVLGDDKLYFGAWCPGGSDQPWPEWPQFLAGNDPNKDGKIELTEYPEAVRDFYRGIDTDQDGLLTEADLNHMREISSRGENMLVAVKAGGQGDITASHVDWTFTKGLPYVPSPVYYRGRVYMSRDGGILSMLDATTGRAIHGPKRSLATGSYYASPVAADGRIYFASLPGVLTVLQAGADRPEVMYQADFEDRIFATPAVVDDNFYLRTESKLYAFGPPLKQ